MSPVTVFSAFSCLSFILHYFPFIAFPFYAFHFNAVSLTHLPFNAFSWRRARDFYVGATVEIACRVFELVEADERTAALQAAAMGSAA